jgi:hypothetical protein
MERSIVYLFFSYIKQTHLPKRLSSNTLPFEKASSMLKHSPVYIPKYLEIFFAEVAKGLVLKFRLRIAPQDQKFYIRTSNVGFQSLMVETSNIGMHSKN